MGESGVEGGSPDVPNIGTEALLLVDIVEATSTSDLYGWYAVGRSLVKELRELLKKIATENGLRCMKSTGDGYLMAFSDPVAAELAAVNAVRTALEVLDLLALRNQTVAEEHRIHVRLAAHFGEVDILPDDREGPNVSYAFRMESLNRASLRDAVNPMPSEAFPLTNYLICSEEVAGILSRRYRDVVLIPCGLFKLKGFSAWHELALVRRKQPTE